MVTMDEVRAETRAMLDPADRIARDDLDRGLYLEGQARPKLPRWRRLLTL
jgi:hypothetical protein